MASIIVNERNPQFATTQWTLVWQAAKEDSQHGRPALSQVIQRYWQPLYSFARRRGLSSEDAEDATQEFLSRVLNGRMLQSADPAKGKFRSFLLTAWKRFLVDEYRRNQTVRRGGDAVIVSLDIRSGEQNWQQLSARESDADQVFAVSWANSLLDQARQRLRTEYGAKGKSDLIKTLLPRLTQSMDAAAYNVVADQLQTTPGAVKVAMHRLRQRFGSVIREVVIETLDDEDEIDGELNELMRLLADQ